MRAQEIESKPSQVPRVVSAASMTWLRWVGHTSVALCNTKPDSVRVDGIASSWLIDIEGRRLLITAAHSVEKGSNWGVDLGPDDLGRNELYWPYEFSIIEGPGLDFAVTQVSSDLQPYYQERGPLGMIGEPAAYHVFSPSEIGKPHSSEIFAFSGKIEPEMNPDNSFFRQPVVYPGLRLIDQIDHKLIFQLPVDHPGHEAFRGCSGAPIVDRKRRCVGHVIGGDPIENVIFGSTIEPLLPLLKKLKG